MSPYAGGWENARTAALERDGHECVSCGVEQSELPSTKKLHVHHKLPVAVFKDHFDDVPWQVVHHPDNLVTLCGPCHQEAEYSSTYSLGFNLTREVRDRFYSMKPHHKPNAEFVNWLLDQAEQHLDEKDVTATEQKRAYHELQHDMREMIRQELEQFGRKYL